MANILNEGTAETYLEFFGGNFPRYTFPQMNRTLFHASDESELGATLSYKSIRHGFARYAIGRLMSMVYRQKICGRIHLSQLLSINKLFLIECRGEIHMKDAGTQTTYWLVK